MPPDLLRGVRADKVYNQGRLAGKIDPTRINCLGHASGIGAAVFPGSAPLSDTLAALGYDCRLGDQDDLEAPRSQYLDVMLVYLVMYPPHSRRLEDRGRSYRQLALHYGWTASAWQQPYVLYDATGKSLPIDFHTVNYSHDTDSWEWVAGVKSRDPDGSYSLDSDPHPTPSFDPDQYFEPQRIVLELACYREPGEGALALPASRAGFMIGR